jgi:serine/threonine-protein kinase
MTTRPGKRVSTRPIDAPEQLVGRVLDGRYRLEEVISVGGMGIIFRAHQMATERTVAVKVLRPTLASDVDLHTRFRHEIETLSRLSHPNIVTLHDCGQDAAGLHYLVMEHVPGGTLRDMLQATDLTLPEILEVFRQTCGALVEAHARGVIHRDLKFDNLMVRRFDDGRLHVTILDFGVAKLLTRNESITRAGEVPGTPGIIAPELVDNAAPSPQSDLYSLGIVMFTALSGTTPFKAENEFELMRAHQNEALPRLEDLIGDRVPQPVIDLVYELTQKDPKLRPGSASSVHDRLDRLARQIEKRMRDIPRYIPPRREAIKPFDDEEERRIADRSVEFLSGDLDEDDARQNNERPPDPLLVPSSVVGLLIAILIVLVLILIYLIYQTQVLQASPAP